MKSEGPLIRTLVVDDSVLAVQTICTCLQNQPQVQVIGTANDGKEALCLVNRLHPNLVLLDLQMPRMNGIEVASRLASQSPSTLVVIVTAFDAPQLRSRLREAGVYSIITKQRLDLELPELLNQLLPLFAN